jgi:methionyl-tRNA synthetase
MQKPKRYTVTSALPYANGPVHIGHLAGVYVPADIYVRYLRMKGEDVKFICGSDEHGVPITIKARQEGVKPQQIVDKYHEMIKNSFSEFGISFDIYSRTSSKIHYETASEFFTKLYNKGDFEEKTTRQYFDEKNQMFLADRYITGTCPHCKNENAYGDQCEKCGTSLNPTDLISPKSALSGEIPVLKETKHWFLPLDRYENWLKEWILKEHKNDWRSNVYGQCKSWIDQGLQARAVTRDLDWGVPVPLPEAKGKVLYVWFDAPIGYISATKELTPDWEKYWKDKDTKLVHFIGKDNIVFHCIIFPAMLKAEGSYILPESVPANEFLNLEGDKISTSKNWAVWLHEYLKEFPDKQDVLRYVLCANAPEAKDNDFMWNDFQAKNNNELVAILGNFINRVLVLTQKYFDGKVPDPEAYISKLDSLKEANSIIKNIEQQIEGYHFREALSLMMNIARMGNKFLADEEPWHRIKENKTEVAGILYASLQLIAKLTIVMEPFIPFTSARINQLLNITEKRLNWDDAYKFDLIKTGHQLSTPELVFTKIEDDEIKFQLNKLNETKKQNQTIMDVPQVETEITIEDYSRMEIKIVTVLEAEKIPNTDKLMKLTIDLGTEKRIIVSGIAHQYQPEEVVGKQVCYLANLKPRQIKGIESKGMVLMVKEEGGRLVFLSPASMVKNGSEIG